TQVGRRFKVHPNTVRASYRDLVERGWLEWRAGSGFYVRPRKAEQKFDLDHLIATFLDSARSQGYSLSEIQSRIERWLSLQKPDHVAVIEADPDLRDILISEISERIPTRVAAFSEREIAGALCVSLDQKALPSGTPCLT